MSRHRKHPRARRGRGARAARTADRTRSVLPDRSSYQAARVEFAQEEARSHCRHGIAPLQVGGARAASRDHRRRGRRRHARGDRASMMCAPWSTPVRSTFVDRVCAVAPRSARTSERPADLVAEAALVRDPSRRCGAGASHYACAAALFLLNSRVRRPPAGPITRESLVERPLDLEGCALIASGVEDNAAASRRPRLAVPRVD